MTNTWLNAGIAGVGVGVGAGVAVGVVVGAGVGEGVGVATGVGVGVATGLGVGVATGLGVGVGVGFVLGFGVALLTAGGVGVPGAELVGFAIGVPAPPGADAVEDWDGARAIGGCVMDPGALGGPSSNDVIHKSKAPKAVQMMSRRSNHMNGTPPTHH
jgi:hypothetical protein